MDEMTTLAELRAEARKRYGPEVWAGEDLKTAAGQAILLAHRSPAMAEDGALMLLELGRRGIGHNDRLTECHEDPADEGPE